MEATLILATLTQHATLDLIDQREPAASASITLAPKGKLLMRVGRASSAHSGMSAGEFAPDS